MSILQFHGSKDEINRIISGELQMPNFSRIILKEKIKVNAYVQTDEDMDRSINNPDEPLNIIFRNDPLDIKLPNYKLFNDFDAEDNSSRSVTLGDKFKSNNPVQLHIEPSIDNDDIFSGRYEKHFAKHSLINSNWSSIFTRSETLKSSKFFLPISNALVINDSYIFERIESGKNLGLLNLVNLFSEILPNDSFEEFHILIITAVCKWNPLTAQKNFDSILDELQAKFKYPIFLELVIWESSKTDNHKRLLISNYYTFSADYGFNIFNIQNKVVGTNDITVKNIFHDVNQPGDSPYEQSNFRLQSLYKTYKSAKDWKINSAQVMGRIYISNDKMEKINRLFVDEK
jgi:hypothetical protein